MKSGFYWVEEVKSDGDGPLTMPQEIVYIDFKRDAVHVTGREEPFSVSEFNILSPQRLEYGPSR